MRGRKPKLTALKRLAGNPGKRKLNDREPVQPVPPDAFDAPPDELTQDAAATKEWLRLAPILRKSRQISESDRSALIAVCLEWSKYCEAMGIVRMSSMIIKTSSGYRQINPYLSVATKSLSNLNKLWPELGLTPSSRSRVQALPDNDAADPWAEFDRPRPILVSNRT
jgi:P27 family predicted phage terminase small subunit|tara:strand:- start:3983 stop:4483 length:501 start_codon:yes stop_codon:yes gene_type:complete